MVKQLPGSKIDKAGIWQIAGLWLAVLAFALCVIPASRAQSTSPFAQDQPRKAKHRKLLEQLPGKPSQPPAFTIPVIPLGFTVPGALHLGQRWSHSSLDFLDENRLLFTFRVPGLIHRESEENEQSDERQIRALVLALPAGTVESEGLWTLHDRARYLWMLNDGHFLLRDRDMIEQGDASLQLKPLLHFPGPLLWMEMDPAQRYLVTDSLEPAATATRPGDVSSPVTAQANIVVDGQNPSEQQDTVVRILHRASGQVMLVSRTTSSVHLPINSDGYLESLRGIGAQWLLNLNYFTGGSRILGHVNSSCSPALNFVSQGEVLVTACTPDGAYNLIAMTTNGRLLWQDTTSAASAWPLLVNSPNGLRLARETLTVIHPINAYSPLDAVDIKGQLVEVLDAADGQVALMATATPVLDAGGNVAISPSGRRVAVLNAGSIQVFELPAPPPLPAATRGPSGR
jgi:hypothetical protein